MKNKILYTLLMILFSFLFLEISYAAKEKAGTRNFSGRIIYLTNDYMEIKKGNSEITVYFSSDTKYISTKGAPADKNIIKLCQYVTADYFVQGSKKILDKIVVIKESICIK